MLGTRQVSDKQTRTYATGGDFCRIFKKDMNRLYLLSFLLTGDRSMAEKCFVRGLDDSAEGNPVFKEWARSWAGRTIIRNAIQMIRPRPTDSGASKSTSVGSAGHEMTEAAEIAEIIDLPAFDRFALVMSVLERYSDQECSLLLNCTRGDVGTARSRALQQMGISAARLSQLAGVRSDGQERRWDTVALQLDGSSHLAVSA